MPRRFLSKRRTYMIQSAVCSPDPEEAFTYPESVCNPIENFLRTLEVSRPPQNPLYRAQNVERFVPSGGRDSKNP